MKILKLETKDIVGNNTTKAGYSIKEVRLSFDTLKILTEENKLLIVEYCQVANILTPGKLKWGYEDIHIFFKKINRKSKRNREVDKIYELITHRYSNKYYTLLRQFIEKDMHGYYFNTLNNNKVNENFRFYRLSGLTEYSLTNVDGDVVFPFSNTMNLEDNMSTKFINSVKELDSYVMLKKLMV